MTQHNTTQRLRSPGAYGRLIVLATIGCFSLVLCRVAPAAWISTNAGYHVTQTDFYWYGQWGLSPGESFYDLRGLWRPTGTQQRNLASWSRAYISGTWEARASYLPGQRVDVWGYLAYIPVGFTQPVMMDANVLVGI